MNRLFSFHWQSWYARRGDRAPSAQTPAYDLVIRGGRIVDGTGNPWFWATSP